MKVPVTPASTVDPCLDPVSQAPGLSPARVTNDPFLSCSSTENVPSPLLCTFQNRSKVSVAHTPHDPLSVVVMANGPKCWSREVGAAEEVTNQRLPTRTTTTAKNVSFLVTMLNVSFFVKWVVVMITTSCRRRHVNAEKI